MKISTIVAESTSIEYKVSLEESKPKSWLKTVSAFANTKGGALIFGIRDNDQAKIGLTKVSTISEKITQFINSRIQPCPRYDLTVIEENRKNFLVVKIGDGPVTPYYYTNEGTREAFVRKGNQSVIATPYELNQLIMKGMNRTFDALPSACKFGEVSFNLLQATFKQETGNDFDLERDLVSLGLMQPDGILTNAGLLLSDQGTLKQSRIFCTRWRGLEKGNLDQDAFDDKEYYGSIIDLLFDAEKFIQNNSKTPWQIVGMRREERSDYPPKSVREVLVNAIIHRDYQILGSEIHIDMYDDRLEVTSPGGMPDGSRIQDLDLKNIPSLRRNHTISEIFLRLDYMDRRGSGINRILKDYSDSREKPTFFSESSWFRVSVPNRNYREKTSILGEKTSILGEKTSILGEKTSILGEKTSIVVDSTSIDEQYFIQTVTKINDIREKTRNKILALQKKYKFENSFTRMDIMRDFDITERQSSRMISILIKHNLVEKDKAGQYAFKK